MRWFTYWLSFRFDLSVETLDFLSILLFCKVPMILLNFSLKEFFDVFDNVSSPSCALDLLRWLKPNFSMLHLAYDPFCLISPYELVGLEFRHIFIGSAP